MARNDIHRPSVIIPADYVFVGIEADTGADFGTVMALAEERRRIQEHMRRTGGTYSRHAHGGACMVCGNVNAIFTALFHHAASNTYVRMGRDCSEKCDMGNEAAFRRITDAVTAAREARAGKLKAQGILSDADCSRAWEIYESGAAGREENIIRDIVSKLVRYGSLSDAQFAFLRKLLAAIPERQARDAAREAEREAAAPVRAGRFTIEAEVLSVKTQDASAYGRAAVRLVMTVRTAEGWLAWGTAPSDFQRGDKIELTATFEPSEKDPKFGFFKRPKVTVKQEA